MNATTATLELLDPKAFRFYRRSFKIMETAKIPFLVGGAYALDHYTGISRHTKDLDLFVRPADVDRTLAAFTAAGYRTELFFSHWLGKVFHGDDFVDIIFCSGNGLCGVDDAWFDHAEVGEVLGTPVGLVPVEEMIWQKAYIMERERFDGADVSHLLRARGQQLAWDRLLARFGPHWRVLFSHLVLFGFAYPNDRDSVPDKLLTLLSGRLREEAPEPSLAPLCQGTFLSRKQYLTDIEEWNYIDPRLGPAGPMSKDQVTRWTDAGR